LLEATAEGEAAIARAALLLLLLLGACEAAAAEREALRRAGLPAARCPWVLR